MIALVRAEVEKQARRPRTWVTLGLMAAIPIIITFALWANPPTLGGEGGGAGDNLFYLATHDGLLLPAAVLQVMSRFLLIGVAALFAGDAIASEASWGNLRALLTRPIPRGRLAGVKLGIAVVLAFLATIIVVVTALIAGQVAWGWHSLNLDLGPFGSVHQSASALASHLGIATGYVAWSLTSIMAFGFMISTMSDSPAGAGAAAFGLYVTSSILDNIRAIGVIRNVFPTHYIDAWNSMFTQGTVSSDMARGALLQIGYLIVFCGIGFWYFRRKDINS